MRSQYDTLTSFFEQYERASNSGNLDAILPLFADPFTVVTQHGSQIVRISDFGGVVSRRKALFEKLGCKETALGSLKATPVNDHSALVETTWRMRFLLSDGRSENFVVASSFLVYLREIGPQIFVYTPHQDIMAILAERGILPAA